jgi:hypothetical protein
MDQTIGRLGKFANCTTELFEKLRLSWFGNRVNGIEAQSVEPIMS